ncbi:MAG: flagellin [Chloroflexi bacterium]|nr:flagellin [Chloroflexota bacterium]
MISYRNCTKIISSMGKDENGMAGLEIAIILIAFVTVAAVFSYAVLSAGIFAADREKETLHSALSGAKSNLELSGSVIAADHPETSSVNEILFSVKNAVAGNPIDMTPCDGAKNATNKCVISLTTHNNYISNVKWTWEAIGSNDGDNLLEIGEQFEVTIDLNDLGYGQMLSENMTSNDYFNIQVKPSIGSTITVQRTLPPAIESLMDLH